MRRALFISHSSNDVVVAARVVDLLQKAFRLSADSILCSSVDGYRLDPGDVTDEVVRKELLDADAFIALLTKASIQSMYVLCELGARWGSGRQVIPLLAGGIAAGDLKAPISNLNCLSAESTASVLQLLEGLERILGIKCQDPQAIIGDVEKVVESTHVGNLRNSEVRQICLKWLNEEEPEFGDICLMPSFLLPGDELLAFIDGTDEGNGRAGIAILPTGIVWRNPSDDTINRENWNDLEQKKLVASNEDDLKIGAKKIDLSEITYTASGVADLLRRILRSRKA